MHVLSVHRLDRDAFGNRLFQLGEDVTVLIRDLLPGGESLISDAQADEFGRTVEAAVVGKQSPCTRLAVGLNGERTREIELLAVGSQLPQLVFQADTEQFLYTVVQGTEHQGAVRRIPDQTGLVAVET